MILCIFVHMYCIFFYVLHIQHSLHTDQIELNHTLGMSKVNGQFYNIDHFIVFV